MPNSSMPVQHGSAEQSHRSRHRGRDGRVRSRDRTISATGSIRLNPVEPQEHMDWMSVLEVVVDRIDTLERHTRLHAQRISHNHEGMNSVATKLSATGHDIDAYKK